LAIGPHLKVDHQWRLDHEAWSVLRHRYPNADVLVFEVSLDQETTFIEHAALGNRMHKFREPGVLMLGSGKVVQNLRRIWEMPDGEYPRAVDLTAG
jgi:4,5-DOPA dioxygenase extradiol